MNFYWTKPNKKFPDFTEVNFVVTQMELLHLLILLLGPGVFKSFFHVETLKVVEKEKRKKEKKKRVLLISSFCRFVWSRNVKHWLTKTKWGFSLESNNAKFFSPISLFSKPILRMRQIAKNFLRSYYISECAFNSTMELSGKRW